MMASTKRDYYEVLEIDRGADGDTITKAYRKLAMKFHPDRNGGDDPACHMPAVRRARRGHSAAGIFLGAADLFRLRRPRGRHHRSVPDLPRRRAGDDPPDAGSRDPPRRRYRDAGPAQWRG